jgi:hypothetical protein
VRTSWWEGLAFLADFGFAGFLFMFRAKPDGKCVYGTEGQGFESLLARCKKPSGSGPLLSHVLGGLIDEYHVAA